MKESRKRKMKRSHRYLKQIKRPDVGGQVPHQRGHDERAKVPGEKRRKMRIGDNWMLRRSEVIRGRCVVRVLIRTVRHVVSYTELR